MAEINTVINIRLQNGELIALNKRIKEVAPVASQPSIIDEISQKSGKGFWTGDLIKKVKRAQVESTAAGAVNGVGGFTGASSQNVHNVFIGKTYREDNIVFNEIDIMKLKEGKGGDIVAQETGDFIITGRELDTKVLLAEAKTQATALKLHTAFDANTKPTGVQPAQGGTDFATAVVAIRAGRRVVIIDNLDAEIDTRIKSIRECVQYLNEMGTEGNAEKNYLFSINGHSLDTIKVLGRYRDIVKIKEKDTSNFINVSGAVQRNITGLVAYIDNLVKVLQTNQLPSSTAYAVMTSRIIRRDLDSSNQYIGTIRDSAAVVMKDGSTKNLKPNERLMQFFQGRTQAIVFAEEVFFIDIK